MDRGTYKKLFEHLHGQHDLIAVDSELQNIYEICNEGKDRTLHYLRGRVEELEKNSIDQTESIIKKALDIITETGNKYIPKRDHCWISYSDHDGWLHTFDYYNDETYCEDCIKNVINSIDEKIKSEEQEKPDGYASMEYQVESSPENDDFCICGECGELIACASHWSEQEMDQWLDDEQKVTTWDEIIKEPCQCYELMQILDPGTGACEEFPEQTTKIALKIIGAVTK